MIALQSAIDKFMREYLHTHDAPNWEYIAFQIKRTYDNWVKTDQKPNTSSYSLHKTYNYLREKWKSPTPNSLSIYTRTWEYRKLLDDRGYDNAFNLSHSAIYLLMTKVQSVEKAILALNTAEDTTRSAIAEYLESHYKTPIHRKKRRYVSISSISSQIMRHIDD